MKKKLLILLCCFISSVPKSNISTNNFNVNYNQVLDTGNVKEELSIIDVNIRDIVCPVEPSKIKFISDTEAYKIYNLKIFVNNSKT